MSTIHIAEAEAARDFPGVLAQVRAGNEVVIESDADTAVVLRTADERRGRTIGESIRAMKEFEAKLGYAPVMDDDFAADMREIIANRRPGRNPWDDE